MTNLRLVFSCLCLGPLLAGCSTAPVPSEFGDAGFYPSRRARAAPRRRALECGDPRAIRDFKDTILGELYPNLDVAEAWAACLCGAAAKQAGLNARRPRPPAAVPAFPAYDTADPTGSLAETRDWFRAHLPVDEEQAKKLADCIYAH